MSKEGHNSLTSYAPTTLKNICGQDHVKSFFQGVVKRPDAAPRAYGLFGTHGIGKTLTARCFANDLLGEQTVSASYLEYDSGNPYVQNEFDSVLDIVFQMSSGFKVVVFDEFHLLDHAVQQKLLKPLEDSIGDVFIFIVSTNPEQVLGTIHSRILPFYFSSLSEVKLRERGKILMKKEGHEVSEEVLSTCIQNSYGHVRDFLHQLDIVRFSGEDYFLNHYRDLKTLWTKFFTGGGEEVIQSLLQYPVIRLRTSLTYFYQDEIAKKRELFPNRGKALKLFGFYLKMISYVKTDQDFVGFLYFLMEFIQGLK